MIKLHPDYLQALIDLNNAQLYFDNLKVDEDQTKVDAAIYNLTSAEKNLCATINKYRSR